VTAKRKISAALRIEPVINGHPAHSLVTVLCELLSPQESMRCYCETKTFWPFFKITISSLEVLNGRKNCVSSLKMLGAEFCIYVN
jgi:hypothetical protein